MQLGKDYSLPLLSLPSVPLPTIEAYLNMWLPIQCPKVFCVILCILILYQA